MGKKLNKDQRPVFEKLVGNCITYNLKPEAELMYIKQELGQEVNIRTINKEKKRQKEDETTQTWYSDFARFKFVKQHMRIMDDLWRIYEDTNNQMFIETIKSPRNEGLIIRLKMLLFETMEQIANFSADTPTYDAIRQKLEKLGKEPTKDQDPDA